MESYPQDERSQPLVAYAALEFRKRLRGPYKVDKALADAKEADPSSTQRIILDESESAFLAYRNAKKQLESTHGLAGKAELLRLLEFLNTQSIDQRRNFAKDLASAIQSEAALNSDGSTVVRRSNKRRRTCVNEPPVFALIPPGTDERSAPAALTPDATPNSSGRGQEYSGAFERLHVDASLAAASTLFPLEFMDSIQRIPSSRDPHILVADISMSVQEGIIRDTFGCQMEIGIGKEKVAFYAKKLFGVEVESKDGLRFLRYQGGIKIEPDPCIKLRACRRDVIAGVFGADVNHGISTSPIQEREMKELRANTDGISMTISHDEQEAGRITLFLGDWHANLIKERLYNYTERRP